MPDTRATIEHWLAPRGEEGEVHTVEVEMAVIGRFEAVEFTEVNAELRANSWLWSNGFSGTLIPRDCLYIAAVNGTRSGNV